MRAQDARGAGALMSQAQARARISSQGGNRGFSAAATAQELSALDPRAWQAMASGVSNDTIPIDLAAKAFKAAVQGGVDPLSVVRNLANQELDQRRSVGDQYLINQAAGGGGKRDRPSAQGQAINCTDA